MSKNEKAKMVKVGQAGQTRANLDCAAAAAAKNPGKWPAAAAAA